MVLVTNLTTTRAQAVYELSQAPARRVPFPPAQETPAQVAQRTAWVAELALRAALHTAWVAAQ